MREAVLLLGGLGMALAACHSDPAWCTASVPLAADCSGPYCVAAVVVDYQRLEPRGYHIFSLAGEPIDQKQADARAIDYVQQALGASKPDSSMTRRASSSKGTLNFYYSFLSYDQSGDNYVLITHAPTGQVLFAGLEEWANQERRGYDFPLPDGFQGPQALGCQSGSHEPQLKAFLSTDPDQSAPASTAEAALGVVSRLNLMNDFVGDRPYQAFVISHAWAAGEFDTVSADWLVWLDRL